MNPTSSGGKAIGVSSRVVILFSIGDTSEGSPLLVIDICGCRPIILVRRKMVRTRGKTGNLYIPYVSITRASNSK